MTKSRLLVALIIGITFSLPVAAKLYKWVDNNGVTHYGETVPPEYADKDRSELDKSGRVVNTREVLTPDERRSARLTQKQIDEKRREDEKAAEERSRRDQMLISTYSNVDEIELARKRNLQQIELRISGINARLNIINGNYLNLQKEAESYTKKNQQIPASLQEDLNETQTRLDMLNEDMKIPVSEKAALEARYDADKARYKELTGR